DLVAQSIHSEPAALQAGVALEAFLAAPGPAVVGLARGASYFSAAYEFVVALDAALQRHGRRDQATITFITPEAQLGLLGVGYARAQPLFERLFAERGITVFTGATIERVETDAVYLEGGTRIP